MFKKPYSLFFGGDAVRFAGLTCMLLMSLTAGCEMKRAKFLFGVIADVQYANKDSAESRKYRESIKTLGETVSHLNSKNLIDNASYIGAHRKPSFVVQLGDIIDGGPNAQADLDATLGVYNKIKARKYHVLGNHDFVGPNRKTVLDKLRMKKAYYDFRKGKYRFVVLDTTDISLSGGWPGNSENYRLAEEFLEKLKQRKAPNAEDWNGAVGTEQKQWLDKVLSDAEKRKQKVIVFGHHPLTPANDRHNLWNSDEIIEIFESHNCVAAYLAGHRHSDDYTWQNGICYVTIEGMIESTDKKVYSVVWVYSDRLLIESTAKVPRLSIPFDDR